MFKFLWDHADRLNDYFVAALRAFLLANDQVAGYAAFSTGVIADDVQRKDIIHYLQKMSSRFHNQLWKTSPDSGEFYTLALVAKKIDSLALQIAEKDWRLSDCVVVKRELLRLDREYYEAQGRADATVFHRRHPGLFLNNEATLIGGTPSPRCSSCGAEMDAGWKFCGQCGAMQPPCTNTQ